MATTKTPKSAETKKRASVKHIGLVKHDLWLEPFEEAICGRRDHVLSKLNELTNGGKQSLSDFASGYLYFGLHKTSK
ncbi:MAG: 1,4-alpha-glucan-branching enzyme, partial [Bacteroidaceae bacterium]|nr:1,4-alpha-glucan-branching enzyme [Bacteroidaceae bacterium]